MKNGLICRGERHLPYNPKLKDRSRNLRNDMTQAERKLWFEFLRDHATRFTRQKPLNHYIVDFYCSKAKLVIEIDGGQHSTEGGLVYDRDRTTVLESYGLKVVRFTNHDVLENFEGVCSAIDDFVKAPL